MNTALISICIPAYKRPDYIKRLLDSIAIQSFLDFETIITDDSPDREIQALCRQYEEKFPIFYYRNDRPLGTPENWNEAIRRAKGGWIKLMHDDDWFADKDSLHHFAASAAAHPRASFFFSAYRNVFLDEDRTQDVFVGTVRHRALLKNPATLFSRNIIGPPSVVLHRRQDTTLYDNKIKWVVDIDFYIRNLEQGATVYIDRILVDVGMGSQQVTRDCFRRRPVEIPENFYLLNKLGVGVLKNLWVYDAWWRLMRNLEIRKKEEIEVSGYTGEIPGSVLTMIRWQAGLPAWLLRIGVASKLCMLASYTLHYPKTAR